MFAAASTVEALPVQLPTSPALPFAGKPRQQCPHCALSFDKAFNLRRHVERVHPVQAGKARHSCTLCPASFYDQKKLALHAADCQGGAPEPARPAAVLPGAVAPPSASASSSSSSSPSLPSSPVSLAIQAVRVAAADFHKWLLTPPAPKTERRDRPVCTRAAADAIVAKVRLLFLEADSALPQLLDDGLHLRLLLVPDVVKAVMESMERRGLRPCTLKPMAQTLKRVALYLCYRQSLAAGTFVDPQDVLPGWSLVLHWLRKAGGDAKVDERRRVLSADYEQKSMTAPEKSVVLERCLAVLHAAEQEGRTDLLWTERMDYTDHLVVALLLLGLAPRQQTFRQLTVAMVLPPGSDPRTPDQYVINGNHAKTRMVYYVAVHPSLTRAMTYYLDSVLPNRHGALFLQQGGEARQDFTAITKALTLRYIQRPITAGKFRMSVATDLVGRGADKRVMADLMGHTVATQQQYYIGRETAAAARSFQDMLLEGVRVPEGMLPPSGKEERAQC